MKHYHAHIYFTSLSLETQNFISKIKNEDSNIFKLYKVHLTKVGPHSLPMVELHFNLSTKERVIAWLNTHRMNLSILVHEDTGNDVEDHLSPIWLGEKLPIDFSFFEKVKNDQSLSVH